VSGARTTDNGNRAPEDLTSFLPWAMNEVRLASLRMHQHGSQACMSALAHAEQGGLAAAGVLPRHDAEPSREFAPVVTLYIVAANCSDHCRTVPAPRRGYQLPRSTKQDREAWLRS